MFGAPIFWYDAIQKVLYSGKAFEESDFKKLKGTFLLSNKTVLAK